MRTIDEITQRLAEIIDELSALPEGPSSDRFRLLTERDELRAEARAWEASADDGRVTASLEAELASLLERRRSLARSRGGFVMGGGADDAGRISAALTKLHGQTGGNPELGRMNARIATIEDVLASREREPESETRRP